METPAAPLSGIIPWKISEEYRLLKVNAEDSAGNLNTSVFVREWKTEWSFRIATVSGPLTSPSSVI